MSKAPPQFGGGQNRAGLLDFSCHDAVSIPQMYLSIPDWRKVRKETDATTDLCPFRQATCGRVEQEPPLRLCLPSLMGSSTIREHLRDLAPTTFASKYIFEAVPYVFGGDMDSYIAWKGTLGSQIEVDPRAIAIIGSAGVGISLNPDKGLKTFDANSDIDVAVVSFHHFDVAWRALRSMSSTALFKLNKRQRSSYRAHEMKYIYWGTVATDRLLEFLPFAQSWVPGLSHMASLSPTHGRDIKARIYRDFESLRAYQLSSVEQARSQVEQTEQAEETP